MNPHWLVCGKRIALDRPIVMGIVNITPDSFADGGRFVNREVAVMHSVSLLDQGADILDIGGESTRPGSEAVGAATELDRVIPVIHGVLEKKPDALISIDTNKADVARSALDCGAVIINDVTAGLGDANMIEVVAASDCGYVLMHMQGKPRDMQMNPIYADVVSEVTDFLGSRVADFADAGVYVDRIVIDPGIGFGKLLHHNIELIRNIPTLLSAGRPVMIGASRKRMLGEITGRPVDERLSASIAVALLAIDLGASIIRVHDVKETVDAIKVRSAIMDEQSDPQREKEADG
ncbi:dihydropteroate synthase [bacterium]|nr:dihydropteroate synthase [bacterium]